MQNLDLKIELWKKRLLDLGKSNRLINFKETKRSNISITSPNLYNLFNALVNEDKNMVFPYFSKTIFDENREEQNSFVINGDISTNQTLNEQQRTLKSLRAKAKTSIEEHGINTLYLTLGMLKWKEHGNSDVTISSPIVLVPVNLKIESINEPYILNLNDNEVVLNPSLAFKLENDFGIKLPKFNEHEDNVKGYFSKIIEIANRNEWQVTDEVYLALLSFLKMNMYEDLDKYKDIIVSNPIIKSLIGDYSRVNQVPHELNNYDHDRNIRPVETFQVVDADSSQQDAILLSKKGISFVLQGPPGTGKSQTITNIIAEAISDGKKVLFVSEKMAALEVVKKRIKKVELDDFCLTLHSHNANKKDVLMQLEKTLNTPKIKVHDDILYKLTELEEKRRKLNQYQEELHTKCMPLNKSIYEINGMLAKLEDTEDVVFSIDDVENIDGDKLNIYKYLINEYAKKVAKNTKDCSNNPWYGCNVPSVTHELRHDIDIILTRLLPRLKNFINKYQEIINITGSNFDYSIENVKILTEICNYSIQSPIISVEWLNIDLDELIGLSNKFTFKCKQYFDLREALKKRYGEDIFDVSSNDIINVMEKELKDVKKYINSEKYNSNKEIVSNGDFILAECKALKDILITCLENREIISQALGLKKFENIYSLLWYNELLGYILENPKPSEKWFNEIQLIDSLRILEDSKNHQIILNNSMSLVKAQCNEKIIDIKYDEYLNKFNEDYKYMLKIISDFNKLELLENVSKHLINDFEIYQNPRLLHCKNTIEKAVKSSERITALFGIRKVETLEELISLSKLIGVMNQNPHISESWFDSNKDIFIDKMIQDIKLKQEQNAELTELILTKYNKDILRVDAKAILSRFNTEHVGLFKHVKKTYKTDKKIILRCSKEQINKISDNEIIELLINILKFKDNENWLTEQYQIAIDTLGDMYLENFTDWKSIEKSRINFKIIKNHFAKLQIPNSMKRILIEGDYDCFNKEYMNLNDLVLVDAGDVLNEIMCKDLRSMNINEILSDIDEVYNKTIDINRSFDLINDFNFTECDKIEIRDIVNILNHVKNINNCKKWFKDKKYLLGEYLGTKYIGERTDFNSINNSINTVNKIKLLFGNDNIPDELIKVLTTCNYNKNIFVEYQCNVKKLTELKISERLDLVLNKKGNRINNAYEILESIDNILSSLTLTLDKYKQITNLSKDKLQFDIIMQDIISLNKIQKLEQILLDNEEDLNQKFSSDYKGINSDWTQIINKLNYTKEFKKICQAYCLSENFIQAVCSDYKMPEILKRYLDELDNVKKAMDQDFVWFACLFENANANELYTTNIYKIYDKIENCLNLESLEDWNDFISIKKQCIESGLRDFLEKSEEFEIQTNNILNVFLKRFYKLLLDVTLPKYPSVYGFRSRNQQIIIDEFIKLDKLQLEIARLRIRERLISKLPNMDITTSSLEEVGILKRELSKQRKIIPLRSLLKVIPNLLTTLKPCLMMSPLSVSLYLQADGYKFDLIIFDEASQICTEDSIGAIMRGKQVIIAGDRCQLPPTKFFNATYLDNDFDVDYEDYYEDFNAFDSILDEANKVLPERTLKWHYRSRHENLIAFSNERIYKNELTTFPSNITSSPNSGVEYIYVKNGIYDRSAKKNNVNEARRVAELVFEHFDHFPNRSLGVVTFSESQQQAIDSAIRQKRFENSLYERFFIEDKEEEFFIKNLENVQGDERDTIIFSIGYARDANGVMYMNFGPLSRNGGYRRLNVAITRAKFNVKLVGSIQPNDINIDKTNSEGVKMLRQYIEYAINGQYHLQNELQSNNVVQTDSTFEEAIYEFLTKNGYCVKTQIGCSGYRIDMAVKHPMLSGIFVLGIECDGYSYHSARTVRERDRLRQSVLEEIGWTIYKIWSTDWIKDAKTEGEKLLNAVEKAISDYSTN